MTEPTNRDAILLILPFADEAASDKACTINGLAAVIYTDGDPAKLRPGHKAAVSRSLSQLQLDGVVNHGSRRAAGAYWYKIRPGAERMPDAEIKRPAHCLQCGKPLVRHPSERGDRWRRRKTCDQACHNKLMAVRVRSRWDSSPSRRFRGEQSPLEDFDDPRT